MSIFDELANVKAGDVKPPVNLPAGHYTLMVAGPATPHKAKSGNVALRFPVQIIEAGDDVDHEELAHATSEGKPLSERRINMDFWMSPDARYRFTDFCRSTGVFDEELTIVQLAERLVEDKPQFTGELKYEDNADDPTKPPYARWDNFVGNETA